MVFINTFAEGYIVGEPERITSENIEMVARSWKRSLTIGHYRLFGLESVVQGGIKKSFLIGDIGAAKVMLPTDAEFSGLDPNQDVRSLLDYWVSAVIEDFDFNDEANPVIILNRKRALDRMKEINVARVREGERAYGVIQGVRRGAYRVNVGGFQALMPRAYYDYNFDLQGKVGETIEVKVMPPRDGRMIVSRREMMKNPFAEASARIRKGALIRAEVTHIDHGNFKGLISPGVRVSFSGANMRRIPQVGEKVLVEIRGKNNAEFYGVISR